MSSIAPIRLSQKINLNEIVSDENQKLNNDADSDDEAASLKSDARLRAVEKQNRDLKKQMAAMTDALKTLIDLQTTAVNSIQMVNSNQPNPIAPPPVSPTPPPNMTAEQLMFQTAKLNANQSTIEKNMKKWDDPTQKSWIKYKDLYTEYINNGGQRSLYDLCSKEVILTLRFRLGINDLKVMNSIDLFNLINTKFKTTSNNQSILNSLTMEDTKFYNREKTEQFFSKLIVLLDTHPNIYDIGEAVIVKSFFSKIKPHSFSSQLLFLEIKTIEGAANALEECYARKDSMLDEISLDKNLTKSLSEHSKESKEQKKKDNKESTDKKLYSKKGKLVECLNCKHAPKNKNKDTNHYLSNCPNLGYCYQCETQHFPLGHDCKFEDVSIFNYDKYLENKKDTDVNIPVTQKNKNKSKDKSKENDKVFESLSAMSVNSNDFKKALKILKSAYGENDSDDKVLKNMFLFFDSAANGTHINNKKLSDTPINILNRMDPMKDRVTVAGGQQIPISGYGSILNHKTSYTPSFHTSLLSVQSTLASNDSVALFTADDVHVVRNNTITKNLFNHLIKIAKSEKTVLFNGKVVNGMYVVKATDILKQQPENNINEISVHRKDKSLIDIERMLYSLEPRAPLLLVNENTQPGNVCRFAKEYDNNQSTIDESNLKDFQNEYKKYNLLTKVVKDDNVLLEDSSIKDFNFAGASYYTNVPTAKVSSAAELVRYYH